MSYRSPELKVAIGLGLLTVFLSSPLCLAQDRDRDRDRDRDLDRDRGLSTSSEETIAYTAESWIRTSGVRMGGWRSHGAPTPK
jgi:hypothetical protein